MGPAVVGVTDVARIAEVASVFAEVARAAQVAEVAEVAFVFVLGAVFVVASDGGGIQWQKYCCWWCWVGCAFG